MRFRFLTTIFVLVMVAALAAGSAGCGDDSEEEIQVVASEIPDPCSLVDKKEIEAIMGEPVGEPSRTEDEDNKSCSYTSQAQPPRTADMKIISPCSMFDFTSLVKDGDQLVEGLGMHAYWNKSALSVHTSAGDACLIVSGGGDPRDADPADDAPALENAKKVAEIMLGKMGS